MTPTVLATDLDGTLIPLENNERNVADLCELQRQLQDAAMQLIFVTGRHLASVVAVMRQASLPIPDWIIADVGTSIYQRATNTHPAHDQADAPARAPTSDSRDPFLQSFVLSESYAAELGTLVGQFSVERLRDLLASIEWLLPQEPEKQSHFKLSYYVERGRLAGVEQQLVERLRTAHAPYSIVASIDPFTDDGLIDLLPRGVTKAYGIQWWAARQGIERTEILYAGDSGNDSAVFAAGFRSIVVSNAQRQVLRAAEAAHAEAGWADRLYAAQLPATSGVLTGLRHYLLS